MRGQEGRICRQCGKPIPTRKSKNASYCGIECLNRKGKDDKFKELNPSLGLSTATTGAVGELLVAVDLMKRGFDVFRALSPSSSCDLAFVNKGRLIRVEVRTGYLRSDGKVSFYTSKRDEGRSDLYACVVHASNTIHYVPDLSGLIAEGADR